MNFTLQNCLQYHAWVKIFSIKFRVGQTSIKKLKAFFAVGENIFMRARELISRIHVERFDGPLGSKYSLYRQFKAWMNVHACLFERKIICPPDRTESSTLRIAFLKYPTLTDLRTFD